MKKIILTSLSSLLLFVGVKAQTTVTITCTGTPGSYNSGSVNSAGTVNDGNMVTINASANVGWAKFDLSTLPAAAIITAATCNFTTYSTTVSSVANDLHGFIGNPATIPGATLYTDCSSGPSFNSSTWSAGALNSKPLNASGISFIQNNLLSPNLCIGYVRGSTNTYNIYGYPGTATQQPQIVLTYSLLPACSGSPTAGTTVASNTLICAPQTVNLSLSGATAASGLTYQWQSSPNGTTWTSIPTVTMAVASPSVSATTYFQCLVSCGASTATSTPVMVAYGTAPTAGSSVASSTMACVGQAINLGLSGASSLPGLLYQWQSSSNGTTWTSIPTATTSTISQTITTAIYYQSVLTCGTQTAASTPVQIGLTAANSYAAVPFLEAFDNTWQNRCDNQNVPTTAYWSSNPTTSDSSWRRQDAGTSANWAAPTTGTVAPIGTGCADFHSYEASGGTKGDLDAYINMGTSQNYVMSFYMFNASGDDSLYVWLSTDGGSTFTRKAGYNVATSWTKQFITFGPVNSASCVVRFSAISDFGNDDIGLDSVNLFTAACITSPVAGTITGPTSVNYNSTNTYSVSPAVGNIQWYTSTNATGGPLTAISGATLTAQPITASTAGIVYYTVIASSVGCVNDTSNTALMVTVNFTGDNVCGAIPLPVGTSTVYYKPAGASIQTGEVAPPGGACQTNNSWCNNTLDNTMWFSFVAPASGYVSAQSPGFDTQLAIWKASSCGNLLNAATATLVAANDDDPNYTAHGGADYSSYVQAACLTPGATYYVQLDSYNPASSTDSTQVLIKDMGTLDLSFSGLASAYCLPSAVSASLTPTVSGGVFTINTNTTSVTVFTPSLTTVGTQTVNYSLFGCSTYSTTMVVNSPTVTSVSSATAICAGSSATFTASGATSYTWTPGSQTTATIAVTPTATTVYTVTGVSGACSATSTVSLQVNPNTTVSISAPAIVCTGQATTLMASGANSYTWMPGGQTTSSIVVTPTVTSSYSVTGNNPCGSHTASTTLSVTATTIVNATTTSATLCPGHTATLTAGGSTASYTWMPGGQTTANIVVTPSVTTSYTVHASSSCGTATASITEQVVACAGIENFTNSDAINLYPNPNAGLVTLTIPAELVDKSTIEVYDIIGKLIVKQTLINLNTSINTSLLQNGAYVYKVYDNNGVIITTGQMLKAGQ